MPKYCLYLTNMETIDSPIGSGTSNVLVGKWSRTDPGGRGSTYIESDMPNYFSIFNYLVKIGNKSCFSTTLVVCFFTSYSTMRAQRAHDVCTILHRKE